MVSGQGFQAGVNAGYLMHLQPETYGLGPGVQAGVWASWPVTPTSRLQLSMGHRRLGGFNRLYLETGISSTPAETRRTVSAIQLTALRYLDAEAGWAFQPSPESPWSCYAGAYYAHLVHWQDFDFSITSIEKPGRRGIEITDPNWPVRNELNSGDVGLRLGVSYQLLDGLSAQFHLRKGFSDLVPGALFTDTSKDHLTAFSLGLSARLF